MQSIELDRRPARPTRPTRPTRDGERRVLTQVVSDHLPLVHTIVGRAAGSGPAADELVRSVLVMALREQEDLHVPATFRHRLICLTVRALRDQRPPARPGVIGPAIVQLGLHGARQDAELASRWIDEPGRVLMSLWWLEAAGDLTRDELAAAMGLSYADVSSQVRELRQHLETARHLELALAAAPPCPRLSAELTGWDGVPSGAWRQRLATHLEGCARCQLLPAGADPLDQVLGGLPLVPASPALGCRIVSEVLRARTPGAPAAAVLPPSGRSRFRLPRRSPGRYPRRSLGRYPRGTTVVLTAALATTLLVAGVIGGTQLLRLSGASRAAQPAMQLTRSDPGVSGLADAASLATASSAVDGAGGSAAAGRTTQPPG